MIRLEKVNKYFNRFKKNQIHVINECSIDFPTKGLVALLGPSGCGKTTLLNAIGGLDNVNSGNIYVNNIRLTKRRVSKKDEIRNLNIGYIFQDYKLVENMTVYENVALSLKIIGIKDKEEIKKRVLYTLEKVNMERYKNRPVNMLSGGERQRVGIARALVKNPKIIIADEPTGNLDSKNSLEVMNIIKNISSKYLVILVTHEVELAKFYADRIIELKDGVVESDYENKYEGSLDYKIENRIYLKDFKNITNIEKDNININIYRDKDEDLDIEVVFKNGNIYIETKTKEKIEVVDNNSNIELINDHYKEIKRKETKSKDYDIESVMNNKYIPKYSSIFHLGSFISYGFKKVIDYPFLKKILLAGFFLSGMFIFYATSSIFATLDIKDEDFITMNKEYLTAKIKNIKIDKYLEYENNSDISYILPSDSLVNFTMNYDKYLQTQDYEATITGSISSLSLINNSNLIMGSMPQNNYEIVIDKSVLEKTIKINYSYTAGFFNSEDYLNQEVKIKGIKFKIVGITDINEPNIYINKDMLLKVIYLSSISNEYVDTYEYGDTYSNTLFDISLIKNDIKLVTGVYPNNDYEVIINNDYEEDYPINKEIDIKINGKKLKVVGYYENRLDNNYNYLLVNSNMIKYNLIENASNITMLTNNKDNVIDYLHSENINIKDAYTYDKDKYINSIKEQMINTLVVSGVILGISLIEILLMIRSSFLSRIKEVGIYRAIGVKKTDIYKMFSGEIFAITIMASWLGIAFITYILYSLCKIDYMESLFMVNTFTFVLSLLFVLVFNLIVGLLPVFNTIRKTPAQILARYDVD